MKERTWRVIDVENDGKLTDQRGGDKCELDLLLTPPDTPLLLSVHH